MVAPEKAGTDYIVYQRESLTINAIKGRGANSVTEAIYSIIIVNDNYTEGLKATEKLINLLNDYSNDEVMDIQLVTCREMWAADSYLQEVQIKVII